MKKKTQAEKDYDTLTKEYRQFEKYATRIDAPESEKRYFSKMLGNIANQINSIKW
jgi:hypothetical protein